MRYVYYSLLLIVSGLLQACPNKQVLAKDDAMLEGTWVRDADIPGRQPADTLVFSTTSGKTMLSFYSAGSPGPNWPDHASTEYRFENGKFSFKDYSGSGYDFVDVNSFEWITPRESFTVKLHQLLLYMSADYYVNYRKIK